MSGKSRLALFFGLILLAVGIGAVLIYMEYSHSRIAASEASVKAESYSVGIDYSGLISKQFIEEGDRVRAGQDLFYIQSNVLKQSMQELGLTKDELLYPLNEKGEIILKASKAGVVSNIEFTQGSFVPANKEIAQIMSSEVVFVDATFRMPERDFARITKDTRIHVDLPNGSTSTADVSNINVRSQMNNEVTAIVRAKLTDVDTTTFISASGTPARAALVLNEHSFYDNQIQPFVASIWPWK